MMQLIQIRPETCEKDNMFARISLPGGTELKEEARNSKTLQVKLLKSKETSRGD